MSQHTHAEGTGGIRRGPRLADNFTVLSNSVINDDRLSFRARAVLIWLLSKPADWCIRSEAIAAQSPAEGREAIRTAMRELASLGYLVREKIQDERGRWSTIQTVYEVPATDFPPGPKPRKSNPGTAEVGRPGPLTKEVLPRTETNNHRTRRTRPPLAEVETFASSSVESDSPTQDEKPGPYEELIAACTEAELTATFAHVKPAQKNVILTMIDVHGIPALVRCAKSMHREANPTLFAQGWIRAWSALPVRPPRPSPRVRCHDCEGTGFVLNDDDLAVRCACRRPVAA